MILLPCITSWFHTCGSEIIINNIIVYSHGTLLSYTVELVCYAVFLVMR